MININQVSKTPKELRQRNDLVFDFTEVPKYYGGGKGATHWYTAVSLVAPPSERYFCEVMRKARDLVPQSEVKLREDMEGFIKQESMHSRIHHQFNKHVETLGYDFSEITEMYEDMFTSFKKYPIRKQLAILAAGEHLTYTLSKTALTTNIAKHMHPEAKRLFDWHALEEIEHKSVAFDLCAYQGTGYLERAWGLAMVYKSYVKHINYAIRMVRKQDASYSTTSKKIKNGMALNSASLKRAAEISATALEYLKPGYTMWTKKELDFAERVLAPAEKAIYEGNPKIGEC
ncbi:hypothetical protein A9Q99_00320 [Gammaproteobacteria bacterium 45_16_T64]|nr:hypothetical protein A9Q99_00320 [Gammaproteobacteria bacterium 45_16_T64]